MRNLLQCLFATVLVALAAPVLAQEATLDDLAWLEGNWHSPEPPEYPVDERYWRDGERIFGLYEEYDITGTLTQYGLMMFRIEDRGLTLRIQYFESDLRTTEASPSVYLLTSVGSDRWEFMDMQEDGSFTYIRTGPDSYQQMIASTQDETSDTFTYTRSD